MSSHLRPAAARRAAASLVALVVLFPLAAPPATARPVILAPTDLEDELKSAGNAAWSQAGDVIVAGGRRDTDRAGIWLLGRDGTVTELPTVRPDPYRMAVASAGATVAWVDDRGRGTSHVAVWRPGAPVTFTPVPKHLREGRPGTMGFRFEEVFVGPTGRVFAEIAGRLRGTEEGTLLAEIGETGTFRLLGDQPPARASAQQEIGSSVDGSAVARCWLRNRSAVIGRLNLRTGSFVDRHVSRKAVGTMVEQCMVTHDGRALGGQFRRAPGFRRHIALWAEGREGVQVISRVDAFVKPSGSTSSQSLAFSTNDQRRLGLFAPSGRLVFRRMPFRMPDTISADIDYAAWSPDGRRLAMGWVQEYRVGGIPRERHFVVVDARSGRVLRPPTRIPGDRRTTISSLSFTRDSSRLLVSTTRLPERGPGCPGTWSYGLRGAPLRIDGDGSAFRGLWLAPGRDFVALSHCSRRVRPPTLFEVSSGRLGHGPLRLR